MPISAETSRYEPVKLAFKYIEPGLSCAGRTPIIFMHTVSCCKENWLDLPDIVASCTKRKVYALDARNHGDSDRSDVWNYDTNVVDLLHFMDTHNIYRAVLVGFAMGATTAYMTALKEPDRVEKIFAAGVSCEETEIKRIHLYLKVFGEGVDNLDPSFTDLEANEFLMKWLYKYLPYEIKYFGRRQYAKEIFHIIRTPDGRFSSKTCFEKMVASLERHSFLQSKNEGVFHGPVCVIYGKLSHHNPADYEEEMKKYFPNTQMVALEYGTHTIQRDCPREFRKVLLDFLRKENDPCELTGSRDNVEQTDYVDMQEYEGDRSTRQSNEYVLT